MAKENTGEKRETILISKATPEDDEFVLWLAPKLEAEGYAVFADILTLGCTTKTFLFVAKVRQQWKFKSRQQTIPLRQLGRLALYSAR